MRTLGEILKIAAVGMGVLVLWLDFSSYAHRKMTESLGLLWGFFGILLVLLGTVPGLSDWSKVIPKEACPAFLCIAAAAVFGAFYVSINVSKLLRKNQELAMHVSLLNQENERILNELVELTGRNKSEI